jgi:hypothetical protein
MLEHETEDYAFVVDAVFMVAFIRTPLVNSIVH